MHRALVVDSSPYLVSGLAFEIPYRHLFVFQNQRCPAKVENMSLALEPTARATPTQTTVMGATG